MIEDLDIALRALRSQQLLILKDHSYSYVGNWLAASLC